MQHPQTISTTVEEGIVRLTGTLARKEKKGVLRKIREVPGVLKVEELLTYENRLNGRSIPTLLGWSCRRRIAPCRGERPFALRFPACCRVRQP